MPQKTALPTWHYSVKSLSLGLNANKSELLQCAEIILSTSSYLFSQSSAVRDLGIIVNSTFSLKPRIVAITRAFVTSKGSDSFALL